tara:strand:+ start:9484 stop:10194 length:711 start_codon:yes stop_codon:yes gene_type:complete
MKNWKSIWNSKNIQNISEITISDLIKLDGFDTGFGSYDEVNWVEMVNEFVKKVDLHPNSNVYEIGCGCGVFLYIIQQKVEINCFGIDYSKSLIDIAKRVIPKGKFLEIEAINMHSFGEVFDVIFSHSVFQYFPSEKYSKEVLIKATSMLKIGGQLCLLDINDKSKEESYHFERAKEYCSVEDYEKNYQGLNHLFFDKEELKIYLLELGFEDIQIFPHFNKSYGNQKFRFNIKATKV